MAAKKVGTLIKEARTNADMTQEQLARKIKGLSASDISMAERGKLDLTQAQLKEIAKVTGVTQASLLNAAKGTSSTKSKSTSSKTTKKTSSGTSMKLTAAEKKLVELYRAADTETRSEAVKLLKGEEMEGSLLGVLLEGVGEILGSK